jgi:hypothetical protein
MTAIGTSVPPRPARAGHGRRPAAWQLLRLELRRSTLLPLLPLLAVLLAFTELRNDLSHPPLWPVRSADLQVQVELTGAIVAGVAAWVAGRDGRSHLTDLVTATSRPRWARQLASWAAVFAWAMLFYAACVAVIFGVTARQATWGGPIWWLPAVGAAAIMAFSAAGFALGAFFPGRFTAPLVTVAALFAPQIGVLALQRHEAWGRVSPAEDAMVPGTGIFFPFHAGLSIAQLIFLAGVTAAALGALALPAAAGGRWLRRSGAMIALAGLAAACTGTALASTARPEAGGVVLPALQDAAGARLITYTPACTDNAPVPVCLHPALRSLLPGLTAALTPALSQVVGLPGAPVRVQLGPGSPQAVNGSNIISGPTVSGSPPVLYLSPALLLGLLNPGGGSIEQVLKQGVSVTIIQAVVDGRPAPGQAQAGPASLAQRAVTAALLKAAGVPLSPAAPPGVRQPGTGAPGLTPGSAAAAAARRFAALPAAARHAWLAAHLAALRAGRVTLAEIP